MGNPLKVLLTLVSQETGMPPKPEHKASVPLSGVFAFYLSFHFSAHVSPVFYPLFSSQRQHSYGY